MDNNFFKSSILKTLIYHQIFSYSLKISELTRYLIEYPELNQNLLKNQALSIPQITFKNNNIFLRSSDPHKESNQQRSWQLIQKTIKTTWILRKFPFVKLIAVSGSVAALNASESSDIDLFIIISKAKFNFWRNLILFYFQMINERVNLNKNPTENSGKFCLNYFLDDDPSAFVQNEQDLYTAMEIAHLKVIYNKDQTLQKFLQMNSWIKSILPNYWKISTSEWSLPKNNNVNLIPKIQHKPNYWINDVRIKILNQYNQALLKYNLKNNK